MVLYFRIFEIISIFVTPLREIFRKFENGMLHVCKCYRYSRKSECFFYFRIFEIISIFVTPLREIFRKFENGMLHMFASVICIREKVNVFFYFRIFEIISIFVTPLREIFRKFENGMLHMFASKAVICIAARKSRTDVFFNRQRF